MNKLVVVLTVSIIALVAIFAVGPFYIIQEGEQAVVTRFGEIVEVAENAGLHFKIPVLDNVNIYPKKLLSWDGDPREIPTSENNQFIVVDTVARWKISNPETFYRQLKQMNTAYDRIGAIIDAAVKAVITDNPLREAVRDTDYIVSTVEDQLAIDLPEIADEEEVKELTALATDAAATEQTSQTFESIIKGRSTLSREMLDIARAEINNFGIALVDVVIRQIRYTDQLTPNVYNRMIAERRQNAELFRSFGEGRKAFYQGKLNKDEAQIISEAYQISETIKGEADAEATRIYAESASRDQNFYVFWRSIESYRKTLPEMRKVMSTDISYFDFLNQF